MSSLCGRNCFSRGKILSLKICSSVFPVRRCHFPPQLPRISTTGISTSQQVFPVHAFKIPRNGGMDADVDVFTNGMLGSLRVLSTLKSYSTSVKQCLDLIGERLKGINDDVCAGSPKLLSVISILEGKVPDSLDVDEVVTLKQEIYNCFTFWGRFLSHLTRLYREVIDRKDQVMEVAGQQDISEPSLDHMFKLRSASNLGALGVVEQSIVDAEEKIKALVDVIDVD